VPGGLGQGEAVPTLYGDPGQDDADLEALHAINGATSSKVDVKAENLWPTGRVTGHHHRMTSTTMETRPL
jgi:hypothetical protein